MRRNALVIAAVLMIAGPAFAQSDGEWIEQVREADAKIRSEAGKLPFDAEPCDFGAWSADDDRNGLNVRAEPNAKGKVLHRVPPPVRKSKVMADAGDPSPLRSEFRVLGYKDGWFLIDRVRSATMIEKTNGDTDQRLPMRGWVAAAKVGGAFAYGAVPGNRLYATPDPSAKYSDTGEGLVGGANPKRILACSTGWAQVETADGKTGWFRTLCSSQIALCN